MSSTLACLGLALDDEDELDRLLARIVEVCPVVGRPSRIVTRRWQDQSGALLTVVTARDAVVDVVPGYVAGSGVHIGELQARGRYAVAEIREHGVCAVRVACDLPQSPYLPRVPVDVSVAAVTALGVEVSVRSAGDADDTGAGGGDGSNGGDDAGGGRGGDGESTPLGADPAPDEDRAVVPYGLREDPAQTEPLAVVTGVVTASTTRTNAVTGQDFHVAEVSTLAMTLSLCLAVADHPTAPPVGSVVSGACYLVLDVPSLWKVQPKPPRSWLKGRA